MSILKATATVGSLTILSRVGGFIRDALILSLLGAGPIFDAFIVAFKFPNFFRRLSAEGAFSAAFVPLFSGSLAQEGQEAALNFASKVLTLMSLILIIFVGMVELFTPQLMGLIAPGFEETPERLVLALEYTRITFPYIFLISLASLWAGVMNSFGRFAASAAAPILLNVIMIAALLFFTPFVKTAGHALSWGVFLSGVAQLTMLIWSAKRANIRISFSHPEFTPKIRVLLRKMVPGIVGAGVFQINVFIDLIIGSFLPVGSLTYLHAADRINQLPLSVIGVAISTAFLPTLSKQVQMGEIVNARHNMQRALEFSLLMTLPAAMALFSLSQPLVKVLFERGAFSGADALATAQTLQAFVIGLPAYVLVKVLSTGFFARQDTMTPVVIACCCVVLNLCFNMILMKPLQYMGIALSTALSSWVNALLLAYRLQGFTLIAFGKEFFFYLAKLMVCCLAMCSVLLSFLHHLAAWFTNGQSLTAWGGLLLLVLIGLCTYGGCVHALKLANLRQLGRMLRKKKG